MERNWDWKSFDGDGRRGKKKFLKKCCICLGGGWVRVIIKFEQSAEQSFNHRCSPYRALLILHSSQSEGAVSLSKMKFVN